jgi:hypothetical protein
MNYKLIVATKQLIEEYDKSNLSFEAAVSKFKDLIAKVENNRCCDVEFEDFKKEVYTILYRINAMKNIDLRIHQYQTINNKMRLDLGLQTIPFNSEV